MKFSVWALYSSGWAKPRWVIAVPAIKAQLGELTLQCGLQSWRPKAFSLYPECFQRRRRALKIALGWNLLLFKWAWLGGLVLKLINVPNLASPSGLWRQTPAVVHACGRELDGNCGSIRSTSRSWEERYVPSEYTKSTEWCQKTPCSIHDGDSFPWGPACPQ